MSKPVASIDNLTDPGQPLEHGDRIRTNYTDGTYIESYYSSISVPPGTITAKPAVGIREIRNDAFFKRFTYVEREALRGSVDDKVVDLREYMRLGQTTIMDDYLEQLMIDTTVISQARIDELLADGTPEEI